jgi:hypothetical protein
MEHTTDNASDQLVTVSAVSRRTPLMSLLANADRRRWNIKSRPDYSRYADWATPPSKLNPVALVRERAVPTQRPPLVGEDSVNFCVVSATDPHGRILGFLDQYLFQRLKSFVEH